MPGFYKDLTSPASTEPLDYPCLIDHTYYKELCAANGVLNPYNGTISSVISIIPYEIGITEKKCVVFPISFAYHVNGMRVPPAKYILPTTTEVTANAGSRIIPNGTTTM